MSELENKDAKEAVEKTIKEHHINPTTMLSQVQLAEASGLSTATVNRFIKSNNIKGTKQHKRGRTLLYSRDVLAQLMGYKKESVDSRNHNAPQRTVLGTVSNQLKQSQMQVLSLQNQLKVKDDQLAKQQEMNDALIKQNAKLQELVETTQAILKQNEQVISKHDNLIEEQNKLLRSAENEPKQGFWSRLFH